ncbi:hypothetical protein [Paramicrobacterium chengjingii]|uniref:SDR-like Ig domain-containing protein n=1 Tax=Paramicrobacterium chengjingii TaxID=2769067 RepID=A0ABX6YME2_9MICO|nr:hypothetical protein [Microbacterium chengjingii]QPZ39465.1 hypothetical protein HCR76_05245 [Microbacterium chengjingii]
MTVAPPRIRVLRVLSAGLVAGALVASPALVSAEPAQAAPERTAWTASGPSDSFTLDSNGTAAPAQFSYDLEPAGQEQLRTWSMMTTATQDSTVTAEYEWVGNHAWCDAVTLLDQVIVSGNDRTTTSVIAEGPNCQALPPNGSFTYSGTVTFDVSAGDSYGFELSGQNRDSNNFLRGTLRIGIPDLPESQVITFPEIADTRLDAGPVALQATASSELPVSYASTTPATCSAEESAVTLLAVGTCSVEATQDSAPFEFDPAPVQTRSFEILPVTTQFSVGATGKAAIGDSIVGSATVTPASSGQVQFAVYSDELCQTEPVFTSTAPLSDDGTAESDEFFPEDAGTLFWLISYEGDVPSTSVESPCGDLQTVVTAAEIPVTPAPTESATPPSATPDNPSTGEQNTVNAESELPRTGAEGAGIAAALAFALLASGLVLLMTRVVARMRARRR